MKPSARYSLCRMAVGIALVTLYSFMPGSGGAIMHAHAAGVFTNLWQDFETAFTASNNPAGGFPATGWSKAIISNNTDWVRVTNGINGNPHSTRTNAWVNPGTGTSNYFARFGAASYGNVTRLFTPPLDLSSAQLVTMSFWHIQVPWPADQDVLRVRVTTNFSWAIATNQAGTKYNGSPDTLGWHTLANYTAAQTSWVERVFTLAASNFGPNTVFCFEGIGEYAYGTCIDDLKIVSMVEDEPEPADQTISSFLPASGSRFAVSNMAGLSATASSGLTVSFVVEDGPGAITGDTNLAFSGAGTVTVVASQAGNENWNPAPSVTNVYHVYALSSSSGPYTGGNTITITNGNFGTITNVLVGGVAATIQESGANWVTITIPAVGSSGAQDIVVQTSDHGDTTLAGAYTVNPAGSIGGSMFTFTWSAVGDNLLPGRVFDKGANNTIYGMDYYDNNLYIGGAFTNVGGSNCYRVARHDGTNWHSMQAGVFRVANVNYVKGGPGGIYSGGYYTNIGGSYNPDGAMINDGAVNAFAVSRYDGTNWNGMGHPPAIGYTGRVGLAFSPTVNGYVNFVVPYTGNTVIAGGYFTNSDYRASGLNYIAKYDGNGWTNMQQGFRNVTLAGAYDRDRDHLYVGGSFTNHNPTNISVHLNYIARWNGSAWTNMARGLGNRVTALAVHPTSGELYIGGWFTNYVDNAGDKYHANYIAKWDPVLQTFTNVGSGFNNWVYALAFNTNGTLYAGGSFTNTWISTEPNDRSAPQLPVTRIAMWNGTHWTNVGGGFSDTVLALTVNTNNNDVYAGGFFRTAYNDDGTSTSTWYVAKYGPEGTGSSGVEPSSGSVTGGYEVVITGTGLSDGTAGDITSVTICGVSVASIVSQSATQVIVVAGGGDPGLGDVRVFSASYGESVASNAFTYTGASFVLLGTNGVAIANDAAADAAIGTQFGAVLNGVTVTNVFSITNAGNATLSLSWTTNGSANYAVVSGPATVDAGAVAYFAVAYASDGLAATATVAIDHDAPNSPFLLNLASDSVIQPQTITFPAIPPQHQSASVDLAATASSGLPVTFTVDPPGVLNDGTNLTFSGVGDVVVIASQAGNASYEAAPDVTNTIHVYALSASTGPFAGGNTITITNGNLGTITNVLVGGVAATIQESGANWVTIIVPEVGSAGVQDIVVQTSDHGDITLVGAYTVNPAGSLGGMVTDGFVWTNMAQGFVDTVHGLWTATNGDIYAGGAFTSAVDGANMPRIAKWDGTAWTNVGVGFNNIVREIREDSTGTLYAVGDFNGTFGASQNSRRISRWDGMNWTNVGLGVSSAGYTVTFDDNDVPYFGGTFTADGYGRSFGCVVKWDGGNWTNIYASPLTNAIGFNNTVYSSLRGPDGTIYFGGSFTNAVTPTGSVAMAYVARWDGTELRPVGAGFDGMVYKLAMDSHGTLYAGGNFTGSGGQTINRVARWDGVNWTNVGGGANSTVYALAFDAQDNLYVGGSFSTPGQRLAMWDGAMWHNASGNGGVNNAVWSLAYVSNETMGVGGKFKSAGRVATNLHRLVRPDRTTGSYVTPSSGSWTGGYKVAIFGENIGNGDITNVTLAGVPATIVSQTVDRVWVTAGVAATAGVGDVVVQSTSYGETTGAGIFTYLRGQQAALVFNPASPQAYLTTNALSVSGGSGTGAVSFEVLSGPGTIADDTNLLVTDSSGTIEIRATKAEDDLYFATSVTGTVTAIKATALVTLTNLTQTYDGTAREVTAETLPEGLTVNLTYNGSPTAPTHAGSYTVTGTVNDVMYQGEAVETLVVNKAEALVYLLDLSATYDGAPKLVTATTDPAGLVVTFTYDGGTNAPVAAGSYAVTGTVVEANWMGKTTGTLSIAQAGQTITFPAIADQITTSVVELAATASSGLEVTFAVVSGPADLTDLTNLSFTAAGEVVIRASQAGDANYAAAPDVTNTFTVLGLYTVTIVSAHGSTDPVPGDYAYVQGTIITNTVTTPDTQGTTQYVATGWVLANHEPASGVDTQVVMTVTNDTTLTWQWTTNYWLDTEAGPNGSVNVADGWQAAGATVQIEAIPDTFYEFEAWSGDASGNDNPLGLLMAGPRSIMASFVALWTTNNPTPQWWLAGFGLTNDFENVVNEDTDGDGYSNADEFIMDTDPTNASSYLAVRELGPAYGTNCWVEVWTNDVPPYEVVTNVICDVTGIILGWPVSTNRQYTVEASALALPADWQIVPGLGSILPESGWLIITNEVDGVQRIWRLRVGFVD